MEKRRYSWDSHKGTLRELYIVQKKPLKEIIKIMQNDYGLNASKSQYERIFQRWGFRKNRTKDEWKAIASHVQLAQESGAQIEVYVDDTLIPDTKIRKQTQRYSFLRTEERHAVSRRVGFPGLPEGVHISRQRTTKYRLRFMTWLRSTIDMIANLCTDKLKLLSSALQYHRFHLEPTLAVKNIVTTAAPQPSPVNSGFHIIFQLLLLPFLPHVDNQQSALPDEAQVSLSITVHESWMKVFITLDSLLNIPDHVDMVHCIKSPMCKELTRLDLFAEPPTDQAIEERLFLQAIIVKSSRLLRRLVHDYVPPQDVQSTNFKLLRLALCCEDVSTLRMMLDAGIDINASNKDGTTPLFLAAREGDIEAARLLLDAKAQVDARPPIAGAPLHRNAAPRKAIYQGNFDKTKFSLVIGGDNNLEIRRKATPPGTEVSM